MEQWPPVGRSDLPLDRADRILLTGQTSCRVASWFATVGKPAVPSPIPDCGIAADGTSGKPAKSEALFV